MRNYYLIAHLAARHEIDLLTVVESDDELRHSTPLTTLCRRIEGVAVAKRSLAHRAADTLLSPWPDMGLRLWSQALAAKLDAWLADGDYDVVQVEGIELARYMLPEAGSNKPHAMRRSPQYVFDDHNCEYLLQQRTFETDLRHPRRWMGAAYSFVQWRKLRAFEASTCRAADRILAVSDADAAALKRLAPRLDVTVVPNGIDVNYYAAVEAPLGVTSPGIGTRPALAGRANLVFTGTMDFRPNVDAALWFAQEVLPLIRQVEPGARFVIVGQKPHRRLDVLRGRDDVTLTGRVDDTRPYIAQAAVYVVPLRMGGGTRFKILEAAAMSKAMVSTSLGCEGFAVENGRQLEIADSPRQFADAVIALLRDPARREKLGANARALANAYDWKNVIPRMESMYVKHEA